MCSISKLSKLKQNTCILFNSSEHTSKHQNMKYTMLLQKCSLDCRSEYKRRKFSTKKKEIGKNARCKSLQDNIKRLSKLEETSMIAKSGTKFALSPLLTDEEKKYVRIGKSSLGYTSDSLITELPFDSPPESSSESCPDDEEFIFD